MRKQGGFTLIEMLIVIVVIGILFSMTLGFGASRVKDLDIQGVSDQFVDGFATTVGQARSSSYFYGQKYTSLLVHFASGAQEISTTLSGSENVLGSPIFKSTTFVIKQIIADKITISKLDVKLTPYSIGCQLLSDSGVFSGAIIVAQISNQPHCYRLDTSVCTLKKFVCDQF